MSNYDRYQNYTEKKYNNKNISNFFMKNQADKVLLPYIGNIRKKKILEVGPGYGYYTKYLLENGNDVRGLDINPDLGANIGIEITKGRADQIQDLICDKYDRVLSFFMTEYLNDVEMSEFIIQGTSLLEPGGVFATTVIINSGVGQVYVTLARMKGIKKYSYSIGKLEKMVGEKYNVNVILLPSVFHLPFSFLLEIKREMQE